MSSSEELPKVWLVRLGKYGEQEAHALETDVLELGWEGLTLPGADTKDKIRSRLEEIFPDEQPKTTEHHAVQLNQFRNRISESDIIVVPSKFGPHLHIGLADGSYFDSPSKRPARKIKWVHKELPRNAVKQDLLYSLGAFSTVCQISRNNAATRFLRVLREKRDPGDTLTGSDLLDVSSTAVGQDLFEAGEEAVDLDIMLRDQIERHIASNFVGHRFTELVAEILRAQGYVTRVSPPGPDQSVDIVAGSGKIGLESPKFVVQVKSGDIVADQDELQKLIGAVSDKNADFGMLVSWSGFNHAVQRRTNELFFRVRFWDRDAILNALFTNYDDFPETIRADIPLKRTWSLVVD